MAVPHATQYPAATSCAGLGGDGSGWVASDAGVGGADVVGAAVGAATQAGFEGAGPGGGARGVAIIGGGVA